MALTAGYVWRRLAFSLTGAELFFLCNLQKAALKIVSSSTSFSEYSQTSLIRTPKGQNQLSALQRCPYYRCRECMIFGISSTKRI